MNTINKIYIGFGMAFMLAFGVVMSVPAQAHAFGIGNIIDPACLFACSHPELPPLPSLPALPGISTNTHSTPSTVTNNYTNSNNVNSNINSTVTTNAGIPSTNNQYNYNNPVTPIYAYNYPPVYYPPQQTYYSPLQVSCYSMPLSANVGDNVSWVANAYGGNGSYNYSWTGTDGLYGYGNQISKIYYTPGYKTASVTVISGGQSISKNCDSSTNIYGQATYYNQYPTYPTNYYSYSPLSVSCTGDNNTTYYNNGYNNGYNGYNGVTWTAYAQGGNGNYTYSWTGTDGFTGYGQSVYYTYSNPGYKTASVTVYSNGQTVTQTCSAGVNVGNGGSYPVYTNGYGSSNQGLDIGCYTDPATIRVNQPVTWSVEVTGGIAPYTYSWTGSDGLTGTGASVIKTYSSTGEKNAIVTVTSADGKTGSKSCTNTLAVRGTGTGSNLAAAPQPTPNPVSNNGLSAASLFSLGNVPWGWIAILIILLLFATVLYLIFNKPKI
jgi:hypothetical protein